MGTMNIIEVIRSGDFLVLDCETTGLDSNAEICQIAIITSTGETLLDTLVKPVQPIPAEATRIHGITNEMVLRASEFPSEKIYELIDSKHVIIYNASYDIQLLQQSSLAVKDESDWYIAAHYYCAMKAFAPIYGDWNEYRHSYKWKSLSVACKHYGIPVSENVHSALADAKMTLEVCKKMAESEAGK